MNARTGPAGPVPGAAPAISVTGVTSLPEIGPGADLAQLIADAAPGLAGGDIVVITSKIVSKAEGRVVRMGRDEAIDAETVRVVARRGQSRIVETRHGLVLAAAGVDASNTVPGTVVLLPEDPDGSARRLRKALSGRLGARIGVVISDTMGRPWRAGQTDTAIGAAGVLPLRDHRGQADTFGTQLEVTLTAVADELAAAGDLVKEKTSGIPVAIVRGLAYLVTDADGPGAQALIRPAAEDMFRFGSAEVLTARRTVRDFTDAPVDAAAGRRAVAGQILFAGWRCGTSRVSARTRSSDTPRTSTRFRRLRSPRTILTADRGMFKHSARKRQSASLARPSSGGAARRTRKAPSVTPSAALPSR